MQGTWSRYGREGVGESFVERPSHTGLRGVLPVLVTSLHKINYYGLCH